MAKLYAEGFMPLFDGSGPSAYKSFSIVVLIVSAELWLIYAITVLL
jgi:hypothetical protein